jgi:hypothetical protein
MKDLKPITKNILFIILLVFLNITCNSQKKQQVVKYPEW